MSDGNSEALLKEFASAWNAHDLERMMDCMSDDCEFLTSAGPQRHGQRHIGRDAVRQAFKAVLDSMPDAHWHGRQLVVQGDTAFSLWTLTGTKADGSRVDVDGVDHFDLRGGKVRLKNAFRKERISESLAAPTSLR